MCRASSSSHAVLLAILKSLSDARSVAAVVVLFASQKAVVWGSESVFHKVCWRWVGRCSAFLDSLSVRKGPALFVCLELAPLRLLVPEPKRRAAVSERKVGHAPVPPKPPKEPDAKASNVVGCESEGGSKALPRSEPEPRDKTGHRKELEREPEIEIEIEIEFGEGTRRRTL